MITPPNSQAWIQGDQEGLGPPGGLGPPLQNPGSAYVIAIDLFLLLQVYC